MSKKFSLVILILLLLSIPAYAVNPVPGDVLVVLKNQSGISVKSVGGAAHLSSVQAFAKDAKVQVTRTYDALSESGENIFMLVHSDNEDEKALLEKIKAMPGVVGASLNRISYLMEDRIPNDPDYYQLWGMQAINAPEIWSKYTGSDEVYVAVIDTGIDPTHEDLMANLSTEYSRNFTGYGKAGYDSTNYTDMRNHGSHCSGTIAAVGNNGLGVAGVNWKTKIIALRVFSGGYAEDSDIVAALNYVFSLLRDHPDLKIASVNMSLGGYSSETPEALMAANDPYWLAMKQLSDTNRTVICVAAGNETVEVGAPTKDKDYEDEQYEKGQYCYPASYLGLDNMIIVAAASYDLSRANFSCYGSNYVDIAAPGVDILSTIRNSTPAFTGAEYINTTSPYSLMNGTSMATPHVAGAAALLKSIYPDATAARIKAALLGGADVTKLTDDGTSQHGFLDLKGAVDFLAEDGAPLIRYTPEHSGVAGQRYKLELIASGKQPISWNFDGELPEGLSFDNGKITGTPTEAGESSVVVYAENDEGSDSFYVTINIEAAEAPKIKTTEIEDIAAGMNNMIIILADGSWPMSWDITDNNLKDNGNLSFDTGAGVLVFNPENTGTYTFTITVENLAGKDSKTFTVKAVEGEEPTIMMDELPEGVVNVLYDSVVGMSRYEEYELKANGAKPITWSISEGKLPDGLELNGEEGTIGGAPTVSGDFEFTLVAKNTFGTASKDFTISVTEESPNFPEKEISFDMYKGIQWQRYFAVNGGGHMTFTVEGDSLPSGISATSSDLTYTIYGAPKETGTYHFVLYASNSYGETSTDVTINIHDPLAITTYFLPNAVKGTEYSYKLSTLNDVALKFEVSGELPDDLELSDEGEITGTPSKSGTFKFTVMATNPNDTDSGFLLKELTLNVVDVPEIVNDKLPSGKSGTLYNAELNAYSDGQVIWSVSAGTLPAGLSMSSNGHIYGQPTSADTYAFTVKAVNAIGTVSKDFTITIAPADNSNNGNNNENGNNGNNNNENGNNNNGGGQVSTLLPVTARTNVIERNVSSLSSGVISTLSSDSSMIAAVLPEFTATDTGTYPFRNIAIDSNVPVGRRLVWNSFVSDAFDGFVSDAEESATFLDSADNVIYFVPSDRVVGVNAYIESGKSYAPVITAVKDSGNSGSNIDNLPGPGEPGGGCNSAALGVLALAVLALMKKRS